MVDGSLDLITAHTQKQMPRRRFLQLLAAGSAAAMSFPEVASAATKHSQSPRKLAFNNLHTGEKVSLTYFEKGKYVSDALKEIDKVLRDHRTDEVHPMDPNLLNYLYKLQANLETNKPISIISGYRSPATNEALRSKSGGVAKKSKHMLGKAIDIRIENIESTHIRDAAIALRQGGVGYYSRSNFVHLDTGTFRHW
ncbi:MAG: DUF882 domain-containing protein [Methylococcaceae bacterium]|nr:DUF882 domain-containing protein [Methylococcaceae bacterium]